MCITTDLNLVEAARKAVSNKKGSAIEIAISFFSMALPDFVGSSNDRLVKAGRSLVSLVDLADENSAFDIHAGILLLLEEAAILVRDEIIRVPTVRFGKTELHMPIVTLGCMRFQMAWGPSITTMDQVGADCQDNLIAILKQAVKYGMTHIETARGYGCSELQIGVALRQLYAIGICKREDLIIQTKIPPQEKASDFRMMLETSFRNLQMDYLDLFAFHGLNMDCQWDWMFGASNGTTETCMDVIQEYKTAGKIRHVGFSTHGSPDLIKRFIETDTFEYVNLHYHYFGSYTASGGGEDGYGNLQNCKLLESKDMGIFIISPFDKGGRLYAPSKRIRSLTIPDAEPIHFMSYWVWNHHQLGNGMPHLHTYTVGAGRPSDLDQPAVAAYLQATQHESTLSKVKSITSRLDQAAERALGKTWVLSWWKGLPKNTQSRAFVELNQIVWIYNCIVAFGMYEFGKARYSALGNNLRKWNWSLTMDENIDHLGRGMWGFMPGLGLNPDIDYSEDILRAPEENRERILEAIAFVYKWCETDKKMLNHKQESHGTTLREIRQTFLESSLMLRSTLNCIKLDEKSNSADKVSEDDEQLEDWNTAYDMRPWLDFPDRISR